MTGVYIFRRYSPPTSYSAWLIDPSEQSFAASREGALGYISEATVSKYMIKRCGPPSQGWRTFLANHVKDTIALDFFTVPTATFRILFVLVILSHDRRRIVHVNVTEHPTAAWTAQQLLEACGLDEEPRYLLRDRHLKRVLSSYVTYYHGANTHLSLVKDAPDGREVQTVEKGRVFELKQVYGLHHMYTRIAA
jgi:putative transposase